MSVIKVIEFVTWPEVNEPYYCPPCAKEGNYYGHLRFREDREPPTCPNHGEEVVLLKPTGFGVPAPACPRAVCARMQGVAESELESKDWCPGHASPSGLVGRNRIDTQSDGPVISAHAARGQARESGVRGKRSGRL
jgi:hypothetical protein